MKNLLIIIFGSILCVNLFSDSLSQYELNFLQQEKEIILKNNFISKQQAMDIVYERLINCYNKIKPSELKQMLNSEDVILIENITEEEIGDPSFVQYYYSVQARLKNGKVLLVDCINAQTGKSRDAIIMDIDDKNDFVALMSRSEVIEYVRKYFEFPINSEIVIRAIYDYDFYNRISFSTLAKNWKYCITINDGIFESKSTSYNVNTLFVSPYVVSDKGMKVIAAPDNDFAPAYFKNRLYTYQLGDYNSNMLKTAQSRTIKNEKLQNKYVGLD